MPMSSSATPLVECRNRLGEGPVWVERDQSLYWVDIRTPAIWRRDWASGDVTLYDPPWPVTALAPHAAGGFIAGTMHGLALIDPERGAYDHLADLEPDVPGNRCNDGKVDRAGRFWAGTMDDAEEQASGQLFRVDSPTHWTLMDGGYRVTNGPAFSRDNRIMYHADSALGRIYRYALDEAGEIVTREEFVHFERADGYPDGMSVDAQSHLWVAFWDGWCLRRLSPEGHCVETLEVPVQRPTSCTFAGSGLDTLVITSARIGIPENELARQPLAGALFITTPAVGGMADVPFGG
ncbi:SMP-30/gluconolactonase/LRE family protein [Sphingobium subterraneum]|uniref:Sugar lactone lactonase YvrE n=1 Tax=Sphingobium subterraneum TaxID=627688 RepID=A0A841J026_9SPHN|nr:SMP-30/gluconolactonase/LRE family protein [Sphingobium subterraneum]MBB6124197.1 sugar lactone lactonase YvrE [Sphingobium subterraneum]